MFVISKFALGADDLVFIVKGCLEKSSREISGR